MNERQYSEHKTRLGMLQIVAWILTGIGFGGVIFHATFLETIILCIVLTLYAVGYLAYLKYLVKHGFYDRA